MKSKLLALVLSMFAMSFVAANDSADAVVASDAVEVTADKDVAAEVAVNVEETVSQD